MRLSVLWSFFKQISLSFKTTGALSLCPRGPRVTCKPCSTLHERDQFLGFRLMFSMCWNVPQSFLLSLCCYITSSKFLQNSNHYQAREEQLSCCWYCHWIILEFRPKAFIFLPWFPWHELCYDAALSPDGGFGASIHSPIVTTSSVIN